MRHQATKANREHERELRMAATDAEKLLWRFLRGRRLAGVKFRRQHRIGIFIVDFYAASLRLGIELDGQRHFTEEGKFADEARSRLLGRLGIRVIRFENRQVIVNLRFVRRDIETAIRERRSEIENRTFKTERCP